MQRSRTPADLLRLPVLLHSYRGPLRADFRREYHLDLDEVVETRSIQPSALLDLIDHLSPQASLWRAIRPPEPDDVWTLEAHLLALLADRLGQLLWVQQRRSGLKPPRPKPLERPGVRPEVEKVDADLFDRTDDFAAWYAAQPGGRVVGKNAPAGPLSTPYPQGGP